VEGAVSLLVACLPVIGGRMISHWRHVLTRSSTNRFTLTSHSMRVFKNAGASQKSAHSSEPGTPRYPGPYSGGIGPHSKISTTVTTGPAAGESQIDLRREDSHEPLSLLQHMARMGRRSSMSDTPADSEDNIVTVRKEVYIREEKAEDAV
jgi:hypothetical protein